MKLSPAILALCLLLATGAAGQTYPTTAPATTRPAVTFEVGAWQVPVEDVDKWQARGVTTFFGHVDYGGRMSKAEWERRVGEAGGRFVTYPGDAVSLEARQPGRVGFLQLDEPDLSSHVDRPGYTPAEFRQQYERVVNSGLPMYLTAGAMDNQWYDGFPKPGKTDGSKYGHRAGAGGWFAWCDVAGFDFYLYTWGRPESVGFPVIERCLDRAHEWSGGKPIYLFVETCTQGKPTTMTADQWERQVMHAADYCKAKGYRLAAVVYFSHVVFPNWKAFDGTAPEVAERMPAVNARLREMFGGGGTPVPAPLPPTTQPDPVAARLGAMQGQLDGLRLQMIDNQRATERQIKALADDLARLPFIRVPATRPAQ